MARKPKVDTNKPYVCKFCNRGFARERTLTAHACEKKMRWLDKDHKYNKIGFMAYEQFYLSAQKQKVDYDSFVDSKLFRAFTKFGRHVVNINCINVQSFIDFVISGGIPVDSWTKEYVYEEFLRKETFREPALHAVERNILLMEQWAMETDEDWTEFFAKIAPVTAVEYIKQGRLSPWILLTCNSSAKILFDRLSDEQIGIAFAYINLEVWEAKLAMPKHQKDVKQIRDVMKSAGFKI